ncbi:hypothetical protein [Streptomyces sp. NPDC060205]|uniref:hypothetical protein n=1 Tax=Streptomyces sp. NPDC060205 TaxID=3347072 RepID=UPI0036664903
MTYRFTARAVVTEVDQANDVMQAGVAEDDKGEGFFLLFMSNIGAPSHQNVSLGLDTHCLVTQDHGTAYGCVREVALSAHLLTVLLKPASLDDLGLSNTKIEALLEAPQEDIQRLRDVLAQVLTFGREDARPRRLGL